MESHYEQPSGQSNLWRDQGKREEARDLLAPVYGWFTEGFNTRDQHRIPQRILGC